MLLQTNPLRVWQKQPLRVCVTTFRIQRLDNCRLSARLYNQPRFSSISSNRLNGLQVNPHLPLHDIQRRKMSQTFSNNNNSFNIINCTAPNDESQILAWLSPLEPWVRHRDIAAQRMDSIGGWVLETSEFRRWYSGSREDEPNRPTLFCHGNPGAGKSYIM